MTDDLIKRARELADSADKAAESMTWNAHAEFVAAAEHARKRFAHVCGDISKHVPTVGKHEARNHEHLRRIYAEAKESFPRFADTLAWILWHDIKCADRLAYLTASSHLAPDMAATIRALADEVERLKRERRRVDERIRAQRVQLAWWGRMFSEQVSAMFRRRVYTPSDRWYPILIRRAKARRAALQEKPHD